MQMIFISLELHWAHLTALFINRGWRTLGITWEDALVTSGLVKKTKRKAGEK